MESLVGRVGFALEENGSSTDNLKVIYIHFFFFAAASAKINRLCYQNNDESVSPAMLVRCYG